MDSHESGLLIAAANAIAWQMLAAAEYLRVNEATKNVVQPEEKKEKPKKRKTVSRSCWVKSWREQRKVCDNIQSLLQEFKLSVDLKSYKSYLLMDDICFQELLGYIKDDISRTDTRLRKSIQASERLASTLRFLATGETLNELSEITKLSAPFLTKNVIEVCEVIYEKLEQRCLKYPDNVAEWAHIAGEFESRWQFPLCLGAMDAMEVAMTLTKETGPLNSNYDGSNGIQLLAMADANAKFTFINVGRVCRKSDGDALRRSSLNKILIQNEKCFPSEKAIGKNRTLPYVIVANGQFPLMENVMTPYADTRTEASIINYNSRLHRARQCIERAFGMLSTRFRLLQKTIKMDTAKTKKIILCCCVLHNFLVDRSIWYVQNALSEQSNVRDSVATEHNEVHNNAESIRESFVEYFFNEGNIYNC